MAAEQRQIDWATAEIRDATLNVELQGANSKAFRQRFAAVLALIDSPHTPWGEVRVHGRGVEVAGVQPGTETELRHFLESVVLQANAELPERAGTADEEGAAPNEQAARADRQMAAAFRSFADG